MIKIKCVSKHDKLQNDTAVSELTFSDNTNPSFNTGAVIGVPNAPNVLPKSLNTDSNEVYNMNGTLSLTVSIEEGANYKVGELYELSISSVKKSK